MDRTNNEEAVGSALGIDLLCRAARVLVVVYLFPVILAVLGVGLVAAAFAHLGAMMAVGLPPGPGVAAPRSPVAVIAGVVGDRIGRSHLG